VYLCALRSRAHHVLAGHGFYGGAIGIPAHVCVVFGDGAGGSSHTDTILGASTADIMAAGKWHTVGNFHKYYQAGATYRESQLDMHEPDPILKFWLWVPISFTINVRGGTKRSRDA
jgi:hypothetical protein